MTNIQGPGMAVYIVSASGPYPEKAYKERFFLSRREAEQVAAEVSVTNAPAVYTVYPMIMEHFDVPKLGTLDGEYTTSMANISR
jgi:hypothetical protein